MYSRFDVSLLFYIDMYVNVHMYIYICVCIIYPNFLLILLITIECVLCNIVNVYFVF